MKRLSLFVNVTFVDICCVFRRQTPNVYDETIKQSSIQPVGRDT